VRARTKITDEVSGRRGGRRSKLVWEVTIASGEMRESGNEVATIIFYRGALTVGYVKINSPVKKEIISSKPRITEVS